MTLTLGLQGGKWTLTIRTPNTSTLDRLWTYLVLALVGEEVDLHDDVCGAVVATRPRGNRLQIWVRDKTNVERVNGLGKRIIKLLEITEESGVAVDFSVRPLAHSRNPVTVANLDSMRSPTLECPSQAPTNSSASSATHRRPLDLACRSTLSPRIRSPLRPCVPPPRLSTPTILRR